ncbi:helix-turn-helix domain-containing protein [Xaviernesmea oryzae]|uniref:Transcriptional regulator, contains XRE-family HTH domain n=1 Tax=Xaviernesmea oryzae TaxID=464029 RepID=A0A1X7D612_9HYPH|nr:helix-turn-helix transcriptional regulator [Xaviernesmea oryzae]SMF09299.1 Transcriptional regulator, contains XRE-family HTH domain [Xaviernesmea oryzae]
MTTAATARPLGDFLRDWRRRRRMSQLDLALEADISQRHLSFIESGRSAPSREMLLHLAERLDVPLRERNPMLIAAGFAPVFAERRLDDPALAPARQAIDMVLKGHEPFPALAVDRHWTLVAANAAVAPLLKGVADRTLLEGQVNVLRLSLHPQGLAPQIANLFEWRNHLLERLHQQIVATGDRVLEELLEELSGYPAPEAAPKSAGRDYAGIAVPMELRTEAGLLSFISTITVFGTPVDVTLSELAVESFFPANDETARLLRRMAGAGPSKAES